MGGHVCDGFSTMTTDSGDSGVVVHVGDIPTEFLSVETKAVPRTGYRFKSHRGEATPYTCPVCGGRGCVRNGFYRSTYDYSSTTSTSTLPETCRTCGGSGVIWG